MARISVEQKAFTDPRFQILGHFVTQRPEPLEAFGVGLYLSMRVWNYCQEMGRHTLLPEVLDAIHPRLAAGMLTAELAVKTKPGLRICGTSGRIEWLEQKRLNGQKFGPLGAEYGAKGGRPKKPHDPVSGNGVTGLAENPPPTPTPTLTASETTSEKTTTTTSLDSSATNARTVPVPKKARTGKTRPSVLVSSERLEELQTQFDTLYAFYPRHTGKDDAWRAFVKLSPDIDLLREIASNVKLRVASGAWIPTDPERIRFIPHLSTYLNQRRWLDEDVA